MNYSAGIDIGASTTKAVIIDKNKKLLGYSVIYSGADFESAARQSFETACKNAGVANPESCHVVSTGYGRRNVSYARETRTEISCHADGSFFYYPQAHTLIDIGGQDNKTIKIADNGKRQNFKMNRKCAAGTGSFLEEIANRLKIDLGKLNELAEQAENNIQIGSYCTVFTATEILAKIREGHKISDIVKGIFNSVLKRIMEMDVMEGDIVMSGGVVEYNPYLVKMFEEKIKKRIFVPPYPQLTGAFGAALYSSKTEEV